MASPRPVVWIPPTRSYIASAITYDTNINYEFSNTKQWYFPISMSYLLNDAQIVSSAVTNSWLYYKIDLISSGNNVMNSTPFYVYRSQKCDRYGKWQLFWLNPHGGFDTYTFDKKIDINYSVDKTTYKQRTPVGSSTEFNSYFGGEQIFNTNVIEEVTLRSGLLSQKESQLIVQLLQSPKIFVLKSYYYDPDDLTSIYYYGVPYLITSKELKYEQKQNSKEIYYEINVRPANQKIIQNF